jgi:hypothetical protein
MSGPADAAQAEEYEQEQLEKRVEEISKLFKVAKKKQDLDNILKKFNIKVIKNKKPSSSLYEKMDIKKRIIRFAINEPEDMFDLDHFISLSDDKKKVLK